MIPSKACIDLIKRFEGCMLLPSPLASRYLMHKRPGNTKLFANLYQRPARISKFEKLRNICVREFSAWVKFAFRHSSSSRVLPTGIFRKGNPFEIFSGIIQSVAIKMVYSRSVEISGYKCKSDQAVDAFSIGLLPSSSHRYAKVSCFHNIWFQHAPLAALGRLQRPWRRGNMIKRPHATQIRYFKPILPASDRFPIFHMYYGKVLPA